MVINLTPKIEYHAYRKLEPILFKSLNPTCGKEAYVLHLFDLLMEIYFYEFETIVFFWHER